MSGVTSCNNCGLPIFHGAAGYAGAQCRCGFSAKPNYDHNALADLLKDRDQLKEQLWHSEMASEAEAHRVDELKAERDQLKAENERLASAIRYEQHLADRIGTHGPDCWAWGNAHYECLKRKHQQDVGESILERDTLRKQLDEADEVLGRKNARIAEFAERHLKDFVELERLDKQLDEARELLQWATEWNWLDDDAPSRKRIDAWLEANNP